MSAVSSKKSPQGAVCTLQQRRARAQTFLKLPLELLSKPGAYSFDGAEVAHVSFLFLN